MVQVALELAQDLALLLALITQLRLVLAEIKIQPEALKDQMVLILYFLPLPQLVVAVAADIQILCKMEEMEVLEEVLVPMLP